MSLPGKTDFDKLAALAKRPHKEQAVWFLIFLGENIDKKMKRVK